MTISRRVTFHRYPSKGRCVLVQFMHVLRKVDFLLCMFLMWGRLPFIPYSQAKLPFMPTLLNASLPQPPPAWGKFLMIFSRFLFPQVVIQHATASLSHVEVRLVTNGWAKSNEAFEALTWASCNLGFSLATINVGTHWTNPTHSPKLTSNMMSSMPSK